MLRAIALATETSDVVGTVDLACTREGLAITFVRVAPYLRSYATTRPTMGGVAVVPYDRIEGAWDDGETLRLVLDDPRIPYRRMALAHFTRDLSVDATKLARRRQRGYLAIAGVASLSVALVAGVAASVSPLGGAIAGGILAFAVVASGLVLGPEFGRQIFLGDDQAAADRRALFEELRRHLPIDKWVDHAPIPAAAPNVPAATVATSLRPGAPTPVPAPRPEAAFGELSPGVLGAFGAAAILLIGLATASRVLGPSEKDDAEVHPEDEPRAAATAKRPEPVQPPVVEEAPIYAETCLCQAAASPVIPIKVPRLTFLPGIERLRNDPKKPTLQLELAVVNNGADGVKDLTETVTFLRPNGQPGQDRGLFYDGTLAGGSAIKWHVKGRGTSFRLAGAGQELLDDASIAPPEAFARLLDARTRSVRLHGAAMLARMRDEKARAAIEHLREGARDDEMPYLEMLSRAAAPVYGCKLELEPQDSGAVVAKACAMNTEDVETGPLTARVVLTPTPARTPVTTGEAPTPLLSAVLADGVRIPAKTGVVVRAPVNVAGIDTEVAGEVVLEPSSKR